MEEQMFETSTEKEELIIMLVKNIIDIKSTRDYYDHFKRDYENKRIKKESTLNHPYWSMTRPSDERIKNELKLIRQICIDISNSL